MVLFHRINDTDGAAFFRLQNTVPVLSGYISVHLCQTVLRHAEHLGADAGTKAAPDASASVNCCFLSYDSFLFCGNTTIKNILKGLGANTACGWFAGMTIDSPA